MIRCPCQVEQGLTLWYNRLISSRRQSRLPIGGISAMRIDLHVHTSASACSHFAPMELVYYAREEKHPVVVTTNHHDSISDAEYLQRELTLAGILYLPAIEITCRWGDFLLFGEELSSFQGQREEFPTTLLPSPDIAVVWAHPYEFFPEWKVNAIKGEVAPYIDAVESINGKCMRCNLKANELALHLARDLAMPAVSGSDAHAPANFFHTWTEFLEPVRAYADLVRLIKEGKVRLPEK
jgi:predicted metal-dependent phosphoesterase TrpH